MIRQCRPDQGVALPDDRPPLLGVRGAPIRLVVFGDILCPYTKRMVLGLSAFVETLAAEGQGGAVEVQFRHYPVLASEPLALAAAAAHLQGDAAFWDFYWCLIAADGDTYDDMIASCAEWTGVDEERLRRDAASDAVRETVSGDERMARSIGYPGVPGLLLCGYWVPPSLDGVVENLRYLLSE